MKKLLAISTTALLLALTGDSQPGQPELLTKTTIIKPTAIIQPLEEMVVDSTPLKRDEAKEFNFPKVKVERNIYVDKENLGLYTNYGKILPNNARYRLDGVNGCNAIFVYVKKDGRTTAAVTHYDPRPDSLMANARMLEEFSHDPRMSNPEQAWATIFYTKPIKQFDNHDDRLYVLAQVRGFTFTLKAVFGTDIKVRYQPYEMTPPGTYLGKPSLEIDLTRDSLKSVWHGEIGTTFKEDQTLRIPLK